MFKFLGCMFLVFAGLTVVVFLLATVAFELYGVCKKYRDAFTTLQTQLSRKEHYLNKMKSLESLPDYENDKEYRYYKSKLEWVLFEIRDAKRTIRTLFEEDGLKLMMLVTLAFLALAGMCWVSHVLVK